MNVTLDTLLNQDKLLRKFRLFVLKIGIEFHLSHTTPRIFISTPKLKPVHFHLRIPHKVVKKFWFFFRQHKEK